MLEVDAIPEIDTSVLDDLVAIRHEQVQLVQFRARAEEMKAKVDARVYERVVGEMASSDADPEQLGMLMAGRGRAA